MSALEFRHRILQLFYQDVHRIERDNYSWERFSADGVDRSQTFDVDLHANRLEWFMGSYERLFETYSRLADQESRDILIELIRYRLSGHLHVRLSSRAKSLSEEARRFEAAFAGTASSSGASGQFGGLVHYDQEWRGVRYSIDTTKGGLIYPLVYGQYFFDRGGVRIQPEPGDHLIDGGAFTGDTACVFAKAVGPAGRVYAFDPVQNHLDIVQANVARNGLDNVTVFAYGLSDQSVERDPVRLDQYNAGWRVNGEVPLCRIDDLVIDGRIAKVDFIKMDIEGSELAALRGCLATIHKFRPRLAISIYHKLNDYFEIESFLHEQNLGYRFYLDHYTYWAEETVLYGLPARAGS